MIYPDKPAGFAPRFEVSSCFLEHSGRLLMLHRPPHKSQGGRWGAPGGKVDPGETPLQAMRREMFEETGIDLPEASLGFFRTVYVNHPGYDFAYHMFRATLGAEPNVILRADEHQGFGWFAPLDALALELVEDMDTCIRMAYAL